MAVSVFSGMVDSKTEPPGHAEKLKAQNIRYAQELEAARLAAQHKKTTTVEAEKAPAPKKSTIKKTKS